MPEMMQWRVRWIKGVTLLALVMAVPVCMRAQDAGEEEGSGGTAFVGMQRVGGEITTINGAKLTLKTAEGATIQVVTTDNTRVMKGQRGSAAPVKLAELKVGDGVVAGGNMDTPNQTLHAAFVFATDAAEVKRMRDELGKTYIVGKVTAIDLDDAKMTIERLDKVAQTIGFDETTSFKRGGRGQFGQGDGTSGRPPQASGGESITLADIKVGDNVSGKGALKNGVFVPTQLVVMVRRGGTATGAPEGRP